MKVSAGISQVSSGNEMWVKNAFIFRFKTGRGVRGPLLDSNLEMGRIDSWLLNGWLPAGFRILNNISKPFNCHRPRSRLPNGSHFEASCHCLSIRPISRFESRRGLRTPLPVLNLNINAFFTHISLPDDTCEIPAETFISAPCRNDRYPFVFGSGAG